jgi:hypothetical protein
MSFSDRIRHMEATPSPPVLRFIQDKNNRSHKVVKQECKHNQEK